MHNPKLMSWINTIVIAISLMCSVLTGVDGPPEVEVTVRNLAQRWKLEKYTFLLFTELPPPEEVNDYLHLETDMTFSSLSGGEYDAGTWRLDTSKKRLYLSNEREEEELILNVDELSPEKLVVILEDSLDDNSRFLKIHLYPVRL